MGVVAKVLAFDGEACWGGRTEQIGKDRMPDESLIPMIVFDKEKTISCLRRCGFPVLQGNFSGMRQFFEDTPLPKKIRYAILSTNETSLHSKCVAEE